MKLSIDPQAAIALQRKLATRVIRHHTIAHPVRLVAGVDVAFPDQGRISRAAVVVMTYPAMDRVETAVFEAPVGFPYIPGLLSFRELPAILGALEKLENRPDVVLCDGQGIAHPRRFGIACHLGVETDLATVGVGKSRLCGTHAEPGRHKGAWSPLKDRGEVIGRVLRTRSDVRPVFVSPGHRTGLEEAAALVLACATRFRLPDPIHQADRMTKS